MKKITKEKIIDCIKDWYLVILLIIGIIVLLLPRPSDYTLQVKVVQVNSSAVVCKDTTGHLWTFDTFDNSQYKVNDQLVLGMYSHGTNKTTDDNIVNIDYK